MGDAHGRASFDSAEPFDLTRRNLIALSGAVAGAADRARPLPQPRGQPELGAVHISLAPAWFDPAETPGMITPFLLMYALHDAMVKPMPGNAAVPCLADAVEDGAGRAQLRFPVRAGAKFHNGAPVMAEDVKFSFERYRGTSASLMKEQVKRRWRRRMSAQRALRAEGAVAGLPDVLQLRQRRGLDRAEEIRPAGRARMASRRRRSGRGPSKFVSFTPGVELVFEAFEGYWRKMPTVKRLVFKVVPEEVDSAGGAQPRRGRHRSIDPAANWRRS